jgi:hypothetical protein
MEKTCNTCHIQKPLEDFYRNKQKKDGRLNTCKTCIDAKNKTFYVPHPRPRQPDGMKRCPKCETIKPVAEFGSNKSQFDGLQSRCKPCCVASVTASRHKNPTSHRASSKRWRQANPERHKDNALRWKYGIEHGTYDMMLSSQNGRCAICGTDTPGGKSNRFHLDHCHDTNAVRGLLCGPCNTGIGQFKHDASNLQKAIEYLNHYASNVEE